MSNNIYEFGEIADVYIYMNLEKEINGVTYEAGEPYTVLRDVAVSFDYTQHNPIADGRKAAISTQDGRPGRINIYGSDFSEKVMNLVLTRMPQDVEYVTAQETVGVYEDGKLYTARQPLDIQTTFVYGDNHTRISRELYTVSDQFMGLEGPFAAGEHYLVFYRVKRTKPRYSFEIPHYPYFSLEIKVKGNLNKQTAVLAIRFPAVSLVTTPNIIASTGALFNTQLSFDVIYVHQEEPYLVVE